MRALQSAQAPLQKQPRGGEGRAQQSDSYPCLVPLTLMLPLPPPPSLQSVGRANEVMASSGAFTGTTCPSYVECPGGCGYATPFLGASDTAATDWVFQPAGGGKFRYYIRSRVGRGAAHIICGQLVIQS